MPIIDTVDDNFFSFDGVTYPRRFIAVNQPGSNLVKVQNLYDARLLIVSDTDFSLYIVNGSGPFASAAALIVVLQPVLSAAALLAPSFSSLSDTLFTGLAADDITQFDGANWLNLNNPISRSTWTPTFLDVGGGAVYTINNIINSSIVRNGPVVCYNMAVSDVDTDIAATGTFTIRGFPVFAGVTVTEDSSADIFVYNGGDVTFFSIKGRLTNIAGVPEIRLVRQDANDTTLSTVTSLTLTNAQMRLFGVFFLN